MTNYGTIPTSPSQATSSSSAEYISRAKDRIKAGLTTRRPWKLMLNPRAASIPSPIVSESFRRARVNALFFRVNYAMVALGILFLSLLFHPISLIVFVVSMAAWLFLYFLRDEPIVILRRAIDDRIVLAILSIGTVALLLLTGATVNILVALLIAFVVVLVHAVMRKTDDLFLDEENAGLMTGVASSSS